MWSLQPYNPDIKVIWKCSFGDIKLGDFYNNIIKEHIPIPAKVISIKNQKDAFE